MKKKRSRAIPPVIVRCDESRLQELRSSIAYAITAVSGRDLKTNYNWSDNKIASIELDGGPFQSLRIVYSRANLHCDHGDLSWSYHSHLPLSQMPDPHSAQDVLTCLRIAQRVIDRTYGQDRSKLDRTVTNNNIIADILAYGLSAGNHHGVHMNIAFNNTSNKIHVQPRIDDDPVFEASAAPWMDRLMPCLFVDSEDRKTKFGRGFLYRSIPLDPMIAMRSIAIATEAFPDLQFPTRAKTT